MSTEIKVPQLPESVSEATLVTWHKKAGEAVERDENLVDIETDKVVLEVPAPASGVLSEIKVEDGATVGAEQVIALLEEGAAPAKKESKETKEEKKEEESGAEQATPRERAEQGRQREIGQREPGKAMPLSPSVRRLVEEHELEPGRIPASGRDGRLTKADVLSYLERGPEQEARAPAPVPRRAPAPSAGAREQRRVPMSRIRARIAERMIEAQTTTAMLTSFNEVDLGPVMAIRKRYREDFEKRYGVRLGYMSFFLKAAVKALQNFPVVNASIEDNDIVYHDYWDIGVAVSTERGLVVPIVRDADRLSFAEIETRVVEYAKRAREGKLSLDDITGGTFTVTNGGVFGSLFSTPIINPPQSAILGMHKIQDRAMVVDGEVRVRPMMYIALTYDHRIIDGREAVLFLVAVKEALEDPARLLIDL